jgi:hypothetical protein
MSQWAQIDEIQTGNQSDPAFRLDWDSSRDRRNISMRCPSEIDCDPHCTVTHLSTGKTPVPRKSVR